MIHYQNSRACHDYHLDGMSGETNEWNKCWKRGLILSVVSEKIMAIERRSIDPLIYEGMKGLGIQRDGHIQDTLDD